MLFRSGLKEWVNYFAYNSSVKIAHLRHSLPFLWFNEEKLPEAIDKIEVKDLDHFSPLIAKAKHIPYFSFNFLRGNADTKEITINESLSKINGLSKYMKNCFVDESILLPISYPRFFSSLIGPVGQSCSIKPKGPLFVSQIPYYGNIFLTYKTGGRLKKMLKSVTERHLWIKQMISKGKLIADDWDDIRCEIERISESYASLKE